MIADWKCDDAKKDCWRVVGHSLERRIEAATWQPDYNLRLPKGFEIDREVLSYKKPALVDAGRDATWLLKNETAVGMYRCIYDKVLKCFIRYTLPIRKKKKCCCD